MKFVLNPYLNFPNDVNPKEELEKDSFYSSIVIGSKQYFNMLLKYIETKDIELKEDEFIAGVGIDENVINVYIKNNKQNVKENK